MRQHHIPRHCFNPLTDPILLLIIQRQVQIHFSCLHGTWPHYSDSESSPNNTQISPDLSCCSLVLHLITLKFWELVCEFPRISHLTHIKIADGKVANTWRTETWRFRIIIQGPQKISVCYRVCELTYFQSLLFSPAKYSPVHRSPFNLTHLTKAI